MSVDPISDALTARMPVVAHECGGRIVAVVERNTVELRCNECGAVVGVVQADMLKGLLGLEQSRPETVVLNDDTCTWHHFDDGRPPIAVMQCDRCRKPPDVDEDGVRCPLCRRQSPFRSDDLERVIVAWNAMVDPGE